jgi:hypothetical protein
MPDPKRFAGYESPAILVSDPSLSREQKIGALMAWENALRRLGKLNLSEAAAYARLVCEIERQLDRVRFGPG